LASRIAGWRRLVAAANLWTEARANSWRGFLIAFGGSGCGFRPRRAMGSATTGRDGAPPTMMIERVLRWFARICCKVCASVVWLARAITVRDAAARNVRRITVRTPGDVARGKFVALTHQNVSPNRITPLLSFSASRRLTRGSGHADTSAERALRHHLSAARELAPTQSIPACAGMT
jgi:hypothetical protein